MVRKKRNVCLTRESWRISSQSEQKTSPDTQQRENLKTWSIQLSTRVQNYSSVVGTGDRKLVLSIDFFYSGDVLASSDSATPSVAAQKVIPNRAKKHLVCL